MREIVSASRIACLQRCAFQHYLRYELQLHPITDSDALRFGTAWHLAMECVENGNDITTAFMAVNETGTLNELESTKLAAMLAAYFATQGPLGVKAELEFCYCIRRGRYPYYAAGKIDGIGNGLMVEHKTAGCDITPSSDYWLRLRGNVQVLQYIEAARHMGHDPVCVVYNVARKPCIRPRKNESIEEYGERLKQDALDRPCFYFARREIPILEDELARFRHERRSICDELAWRKRNDAWPRSVSERVCSWCEFSEFCLQGMVPCRGEVPTGFRVGGKHEELEAIT